MATSLLTRREIDAQFVLDSLDGIVADGPADLGTQLANSSVHEEAPRSGADGLLKQVYVAPELTDIAASAGPLFTLDDDRAVVAVDEQYISSPSSRTCGYAAMYSESDRS